MADLATLKIAVDTTQLADATKKLGEFAAASANAEKNIVRQTKSATSEAAAIHKQHGAILLQEWKQRGALEAAIHKQTGETLMMQQRARWAAESKAASDSLGILDKYSNQFKRTLLDLTPIISGLGLLTLAHGAIQATDQYTKLTSQLKNATNSTAEYGVAMSEVKRISSAAQVDINAIGSLYQRLSLALQSSGTSQKEVALITETVSLGLKANGASARESASAMLQLSQSFGSGRMAGEEFNSMAEAAPNILRALAVSMGVPYGALKGLAAEGKITSEVMARAFTDPALLESFRAQAASMRTITGSWVELTNALVLYVGENAKASGGVGVISGTLSLLADNLKIVADMLVVAASVLLTRFALGLAVSTANSIALTAANVRLSATFVAITTSATTSAAAMGVATLAARTLQAAMGPIGWISLAVGAGVTAWMSWGEEGEKAVNKVDGVIKRANNSFSETDHNLLFISKSWAKLQAQFAKDDISPAQLAAGITKMYDELLPKKEKLIKSDRTWIDQMGEELTAHNASTTAHLSNVEKLQLAETAHAKVRQEHFTKAQVMELALAADAKVAAQAQQKILEDSGASFYKDIEAINKKIEASAWEAQTIGKTKEEIDLLKQSRELGTIAIYEEDLALKTKQGANEIELAQIRMKIDRLKELALQEGKTATAQANDAAIKAQTKAHEEMWKKVDGFAHDAFDNIFDKGKNAFEEIGKVIKKSILDMLYRMTVQKWLFNVGIGAGGTMATGAAQAFGGGGSGGMGDWLSVGNMIKDGFTGLSASFTTLAGNISGGLQAVGVEAGTAGSIGVAGAYAGAGLAGIGLGTMIAGDKSLLGMSGQTSAMIGTAIGMAIAGPIGAVVGGALGGIANAAFGMGPKKAGTTTLAGQFGGEGFAGQYQTPWTQKGGWFRSNKSGVDVQGIGAEQQAALNNVVAGTKSVFDNLIMASGDANQSIAGWTFSINRQVATQEQQNQLIIDMAESMGSYMIPSLQQFQAKGENLADTAVRMRDEFILTDTVLRLVGGSFGAVGLASMGARDNLVQLMGGIQGMNTTMQSYYQNFFTDAERHANDLGALTIKFAQLGFAVPQTATGFKQLVSSQDLSTESGRQLFAALMSLNGAFAALIPSAEVAAQAIEANIKALQDKAVADYDAARKATDGLRAFALSVRELQRSLWAGSQTPLSSTYDVTRSQFATTSALAGAGDTTAQGNLAGAATAFLDASRAQATSAIEYARDFAMVQNALSDTASKTEVAVTVADAQLTVLELIHKAVIEGNDQSYASLVSVQAEINAAKLTGTLDVNTLRGTVTATTDKQISAIDTMNQSVLRITDPSGALIGASNAIQTEVINNAGYTAKVTDTLNTGTNPILDSMGAWLNSINTQSSIQTQSLQYLLQASITASEAARMAVVEQAITKLSTDIAATVGTGYNQANLMRSTGAAGETALSYAGAYKTTSGTVSATGAASALSETVNAEQLSAVNKRDAIAAAMASFTEIKSISDALREARLAAAIAVGGGLNLAESPSNTQYIWYYVGNPPAGSAADYVAAYAKKQAAYQAIADLGGTLPAFAVGTNEVPFDMNARLHAGEQITPKPYVDKERAARDETNALLARLQEEVSNLRAENKAGQVAIARNTNRSAKVLEQFDGDGLPATRVI